MKLQDISKLLDCTVVGDGSLEIRGVAGMETATPEELTFLANPRYAPKAKGTRAGAILVREPIEGLAIPFLISRDPYLDFARALALFYTPPRPAPGIHPTAVIDETASIGEDASIGPYVVVGRGVRIGARAVIHPHVVIYEGAQIGDDFLAHAHATVREFCILGHRVVLQNGVVIGGDGFGFAKQKDGSHFKIPQSGIAVLEDDVEIQCISAVDRASVGKTRVRRGAKIDNLVQVGHACEVGEDNIICSQAGLAGTSKLGRNVLLAGQAGISGHLTIHDNATVYAQAGIGGDVAPGALMAGSPAFDAKVWRRAVAAFPQLPEMLRTLRDLKKRLDRLEGVAAPSGEAQPEPSATSE
ncbi:MAG: UDP-3-O-(3-hydroxymyristoyl)glucosamine N-acyltransferase [Bryobacterales bacterium]|nr:UDP-3-O-(3-hydroxymyristoyl)glucosamine N-acyltransferase [Bryobacterales bacterium]